MNRYEIVGDEVELYFDGKPAFEIRAEMKRMRVWWNPGKMCWHGKNTPEVLALAKKLCGGETQNIKRTIQPAVNNIARCCYYNTIDSFLKEDEACWVEKMESSFKSSYSMPLSDSQIKAWKDCFAVLQKELPDINDEYPGMQIIFEYALPYESGRRPDVILLSKEQVIILEFKQYGDIRQEDVDQVKAYARDIREYHYESRNKKVTPVLFLTGIKCQEPETYQGIVICSKTWMYKLLQEQLPLKITECDAKEWMNSKYEPLPTIVDAARTFMRHEELPNIRRVNSTVIPQAIQKLTDIARDAKENEKHVLALVTGVPGAGKTYLGLQYVYDICESNEHANSVYLSGNGPLVKVLQDALRSKTFVQNVHVVVNEFESGRMKSFDKNIVVFDEGQRAWDVAQMQTKRNINKSEPDVMVELCDSRLKWCVLLILVGEGQEIYNGENSGLAQWNTAIEKAMNDWDIVCPDKLADIFSFPVQKESVLDLNQSLRTHTAGEVSNFVNAFIDGDISKAAELAEEIIDSGFAMYFTRDLDKAKSYCKNRYSIYDNKRFGLISSSKSRNLGNYGLKPTYKADVAAWFNKEPSNNASSCALNVVISEFDCQGLEVDMPIIGWGDDLKWIGSEWIPTGDTQDAKDYRINSYRVLLTRGRDGFIVFIPPVTDMDIIEKVFKDAGVRELGDN